jgi:hypothetical protein
MTQAIEVHSALKVDVHMTGGGNRAVPSPVRIRILGTEKVGEGARVTTISNETAKYENRRLKRFKTLHNLKAKKKDNFARATQKGVKRSGVIRR